MIGQEVVRQLSGDPDSPFGEIVGVSRSEGNPPPGVSRLVSWENLDQLNSDPPRVILHLAGEPVIGRWTEAKKKAIIDSRVGGLEKLRVAMGDWSAKPQVLLSASAIGYYGDRGDEVLNEQSGPGHDFLAEVCEQWEQAALNIKARGMVRRLAIVRIGLVLGSEGGMLAKMLTPFKAGVGGRIGDGKHWQSWIHVSDLARLILFALENRACPSVCVFNGVAPNPVTNSEFTKTLAGQLKRPALFPVPGFALKALFGEAAETITASARVSSAKVENGGFEFEFPALEGALADLLQ